MTPERVPPALFIQLRDLAHVARKATRAGAGDGLPTSTWESWATPGSSWHLWGKTKKSGYSWLVEEYWENDGWMKLGSLKLDGTFEPKAGSLSVMFSPIPNNGGKKT